MKTFKNWNGFEWVEEKVQEIKPIDTGVYVDEQDYVPNKRILQEIQKGNLKTMETQNSNAYDFMEGEQVNENYRNKYKYKRDTELRQELEASTRNRKKKLQKKE